MYLLDTSVVSAVVSPTHPKGGKARAFLTSNSPLFDVYISVVTLAEIEFGGHLASYRRPPMPAERLQQIRERVEGVPRVWEALPITGHIANTQGELRAAYAARMVPVRVASGTGLKGTNVETWHDNFPPTLLQITENDLWIAATAITHDLELVAVDTDFKRVRDAFSALRLLTIE